ncbi:MAG: hypothetical protein P794_09315 [Epsilonproteobacteria bacterium (ex Lamellibrachia satsuma)]|nr:MAG: hypothetical protein P794_09315 [Epsilonproteobacteria bacterium (ex Lamellibrachia satsuma)]
MLNLFSILFAPVFVLLLYYFEFTAVVTGYLGVSILFFIYSFFKKKSRRDMLMPSIYLIALSAAYYFSSFEVVKFVPVTLSIIFFALFVDAYYNKKEMILGFTRQFYPKELTEAEIEFIKRGDGYWAVVTCINTLIQIYVIYYDDDIIWAFYTSVGWYILFFVSLITQIVYGKVYAIKLYSR